MSACVVFHKSLLTHTAHGTHTHTHSPTHPGRLKQTESPSISPQRPSGGPLSLSLSLSLNTLTVNITEPLTIEKKTTIRIQKCPPSLSVLLSVHTTKPLIDTHTHLGTCGFSTFDIAKMLYFAHFGT